jgi:DNA-binding winged helix-turn-helix (wHTH) protein/tetratricopeptide (TPR) repeat protein
MPAGASLSNVSNFCIGPLSVRPQQRLLETATCSVAVEPLVLQVLLTLSDRAGLVVGRAELFEHCWGAAAVGDDSLNRVISALRKALKKTVGDALTIETVPAAGYVLRLAEDPSHSVDGADLAQRAIDTGRDSWRRGIPEPDHLAIEQLRLAVRSNPENAAAWGMLALLCRYAAEYADAYASADYVAECERASERALSLDAGQEEALVARATVAPLFGRWMDARLALERITRRNSRCAAAEHELAIVEMTTGRVERAKQLMDGLLASDPLAPCFNYKSVWQHWSTGDLAGMDHMADRAIQLWPIHPAVWTARFWTLAHTNRAAAAVAMVEAVGAQPNIPKPMLQFLDLIARAKRDGGRSEVESAVRACCARAENGPAQAVAALLALGLFDAVEEGFEVAYAYYVREGQSPVPLRRTAGDASINDLHRRVTQPLFTPACASMRADPRFIGLCERIGLLAYWNESGLQPDFLSAP